MCDFDYLVKRNPNVGYEIEDTHQINNRQQVTNVVFIINKRKRYVDKKTFLVYYTQSTYNKTCHAFYLCIGSNIAFKNHL